MLDYYIIGALSTCAFIALILQLGKWMGIFEKVPQVKDSIQGKENVIFFNILLISATWPIFWLSIILTPLIISKGK